MQGIIRRQGRQGQGKASARADPRLDQTNFFRLKLGFVLRRHVMFMRNVNQQAFHEQTFRRLAGRKQRSEEHTSELQSLMRISYAVLCLTKKKKKYKQYVMLYLIRHK